MAVRGIQTSKVSPSYLHSNSTSHTWAFSAIAELIDNAYDPDVNASELWIEKRDINNTTCLTFLDNGFGMTADKLHKMLSFGYCEKVAVGSHKPIGQYGNGFKSGSMRLGKDAIVFTRQKDSMSIGLLSQTYLSNINAETVLVPIITYSLPGKERQNNTETNNNVKAIINHSIFRDEKYLLYELDAMEKLVTGTKVIIYYLTRTQDRNFELDFISDPMDIRNPDTHVMDYSTIYRAVGQKSPQYMLSLREYCSILYLRPRMKILLRGKKVKTRLIAKSLSETETDVYKPTWAEKAIPIKFGFTSKKNPEDYGIMFYHKNRLIRAYEKVGYQKQPNELGVGVVGIVEAYFLTPTHNKQDFSKDDKYNAFMANVGLKLNDFWNEKRGDGSQSTVPAREVQPAWDWVQCDNCLKWRRLPLGLNPDDLPDKWFCHMNPVSAFNRCDIDEEPEDEDEALHGTTYKKTFKKREFEKKLQIKLQERQKSQAKEMALVAKEKYLQKKEMDLNKRNTEVTSTSAQIGNADPELQRKAREQEREIKKLQREKRETDRKNKEILDAVKKLELQELEPNIKKIISSINSTSTSTVSSTCPNANVGGEIRVKTEDGGYVTVVQADTDEAQSPDTSNIVDLTLDSDNDENCDPPSPKRQKIVVGSLFPKPQRKFGDESSSPKQQKKDGNGSSPSKERKKSEDSRSLPNEQRRSEENSTLSSTDDVKPEVEKLYERVKKANCSKNNDQSTQTLKIEGEEELERSLNKYKTRLLSLQRNVHRLLKIIVPDEDIGTAENIEFIVKEMIRHNDSS